MSGLEFHASSKLLAGEEAIPSTSWTDIPDAAVITSVDFFGPNLAVLIGRLVAQAKAVGVGAQLRVVKEDGTSLMAAPYDIGDTLDAWTHVAFNTDAAPPAGQQLYRLQGRLADDTNTATSASVRIASMSLLEILP